ncbi:hypothetical protein [Solidesulfovibrio sp. C21]|uniref:hypothetical protein n=1 Tax=Solidesulfovibrio sp. C21 TaxID=3398613 RepID=UPI0039FC16A7
MGPLTDGMTQLCGEIVALRGARKSFVKDICHNGAAMRRSFSQAHAEMAAKTKKERRDFVVSLKEKVADLRQGFAADLDGARRAWVGK